MGRPIPRRIDTRPIEMAIVPVCHTRREAVLLLWSCIVVYQPWAVATIFKTPRSDPKTHKMETEFTSHSGCPLYEGMKRIAVQYMRVGVGKENP